KQVFNALGLVASTTHNPALAAGAPTRGAVTMCYDGFGNLREATDAGGNTVSTLYDCLGRKTQMSDPDMGTWAYTYDVNGLLHTQTDAKANQTSFTYDKLNRLKERTI